MQNVKSIFVAARAELRHAAKEQLDRIGLGHRPARSGIVASILFAAEL